MLQKLIRQFRCETHCSYMQSALLLSGLCWGTMFCFPFLELVETKLRSYEICNGIV